MGKSALFYVAAASLMLLGLYGDSARSRLATAETEGAYYETVLAREIAQSAFNVLLARTRADFAGHRPDRTAVAYRGGLFGYRAVGASGGPVLLEATGEVGDALHRISGVLLSDAESRFAALTFDGPVDYINPRGSAWIVSGVDTEPPGSTADGPAVSGPGVRSVLASADAIARGAMPARQVIGADGPGHFVQGAGPVDFVHVASKIEEHPDVVVLEGSQRWNGSPTFGAPDAPVIMVVNGDLTITGSAVGYGALLVKGSFEVTAAGTPRWEGLVIVQSEGGEHGILGNSRFLGAMVLQSVTADGETGGESDAGLLGGHFDVSVAGSTGDILYQAHQYDDRYDTGSIDLLQPGCGIEGGLCWEETVASATSITVSVLNGAGTDGTAWLETPESIVNTSISGFGPVTVDPAQLRGLRFSFDGICSLPSSGPAAVAADGSTRGGAFTVRITDAVSGATLLDVAAYHHLSESTCAERSGDDSPFVEVEPMVLDMRGNPGIMTSATALERLGTILPEALPGQPRLVLREVREAGARLPR